MSDGMEKVITRIVKLGEQSQENIENLFKKNKTVTEGLRAPTMPWGSAPKCPACDRTVYPMEQVPIFRSHSICLHFWIPWNR